MTGNEPSTPHQGQDPSQEVPSNSPPAKPIDEQDVADGSAFDADQEADDAVLRRRILIGSQRDPVAYRARRQRDWTPVVEPEPSQEGRQEEQPVAAASPPPAPVAAPPVAQTAVSQPPVAPIQPPEPPVPVMRETDSSAMAAASDAIEPQGMPPTPSRRDRLTPDMEEELDRALGGVSFDDLMSGGQPMGEQAILEPDTRCTGRVVAVRRDDVFVELGGREQGCVPVRQFVEPPKPGMTLEVVVQRFNIEEGIYDLSIPGTMATIGNWDDVREGMLVEAQITGHNTGGLECEVNHLRGFIPISQIALYRVEDIAPFVGERLTCIITEANPMRQNLVLSRRAVLESEKEEAREKFFANLAPGQVYDGVVRKLMDFGAFVDIGGADGLLHVSQLAWGRVNHPRDVLTEGQTIKVRIERINPETRKISLSYRDMLENPWTTAPGRYPSNSVVKGKVVKIMEFGAFVEIEPGVEGLIHISELSHKRVMRVTDVVHEGDEVEVLVLSVDPEAQRMSLSIKAMSQPEPDKKKEQQAEAGELPAPARKQRRMPDQPLTGGLGRPAGGQRHGLKW